MSTTQFPSSITGNGFKTVSKLSDLPAPSTGVITLAANLTYVFEGLVNIGTNRIVTAESSGLIGRAPARGGIIYTGTGDAVTCTNETLYMQNISVVCTGGGDGLQFTNTTEDEFLNVLDCAFIGCDTAVTIDGIDVGSFSSVLFRNCKNGIVKDVTNDGKKVLAEKCFFDNCPNANDGSAIEIKATSTISDLDILSCKFETATTGTFIEVADPTAITNTGTIFNSRFEGATATFVSGVTFATASWNLLNNDGVANTRVNGQYGFAGNTTATTISTINTWVKLTTATTASLLSGFTHTSPNTLTYSRRRDRVSQVNVSGAMSSTANNVETEIGVFVDGSLATSIPLDLRFSGEKEPFGVNFQVLLSQDDEIDVRIRNTSGTQDLTVANLQVTAAAVN